MKPGGLKKKGLEEIKEVNEREVTFKENRDTNKRNRGSSKPNYRDPSRQLLTQEQRAEKYYELLQENSMLKTKQTELDGDIKKMAARLQRIKTLISKERKLAGGVLGKEFDEELDELIDENTQLKSENKKLKDALKGAKHELKQSPYVKTKSRPKTSQGKQTDIEEHELIQKLKEKLKDNMRIIQSMNEEIVSLRKGTPESNSSREYLKGLQDRDQEIYKMRNTLEETQSNYEGLKMVADKCKAKNKELLEDLRRQKEENINLQARLTALENTKGAIDDLKEQLLEADQEKENLEERLKDLMAEPFLKRESGTSSKNRITKLEHDLEDKDKLIKNFKEKILKSDEKITDLETKLTAQQEQKSELQEKYDDIKERYEGSNEMTIDTVQKQLMKIDPTSFRKTMQDLNYQGTEPMWSMIDYMDRDDQKAAEEIDLEDPKSLLNEIDRLKVSKREIAAELEKWQQMLKLQSNLEEEKLQLINEEWEQLKVQVKSNNTKIEDLVLQLDLKQKENAELRKYLQDKDGKYPKGQIRFDKTIESVSDFSEITEESSIAAQENILDVVIDSGEFYPNSLVQMLGRNKIREDSFESFIAISFYDHETKATDVISGFGPNYATQFVFRNKFDDFYMEYLDTHVLRLEIYLSSASKPQLIGFSSILLKELLVIDVANRDTKKVINSMVEIMSANNADVSIGKINYKLRLRNSFNQAIKLYRERKAAEGRKIEREQVKAKTKLLSFEIIECKDLNHRGTKAKNLKPFWYYQFYNFDEHMTIPSAGKNPRFDDVQNYEVAYTPDFIEHLDKQELEVTIFDDSAPLLPDEDEKSKDGESDIIGVAKVPLKLLSLSKEVSGPISILNSRGQHCGVLIIRISVSDPIRKYAATRGGTGLTVTKMWEKDTIETISESFVKSTKIRDVDAIFDIFSKRKEKLSQEDFKSTVMSLKSSLYEREIDLFINSSLLFASGTKDTIDKKEFLGVFSQPLFNAFDKYDRLQKEEEKHRDPKPTETETDLDRDTNQNMSTMRGESTKDKITKQDILRNIDDIKDKFESFLKRQNITMKQFWNETFKKKEMLPNKFANRLVKVDDLKFTKFESHVLFKYVDEGDMGKIKYKDLSLACKDVNINLMMKRFRSYCEDSKIEYSDLFNKYDTNKRHVLDVSDANQMFYDIQEDLERYELDYVFTHFDPAKSMQITRTSFEKYIEKRAERVK